MIQPTPTNRFVLDCTRICNVKCRMCYYLHSYSDWHKYNWTLDKCKEVIDQGISRGNTYMDVTGGEPTIYKHICEVIEYALSKDVRTCIITNGYIGNDERVDNILKAGLDGWLVSRHGLKDNHNYIVNREDAYDKQIEFLEQIKDSDAQLRFNCVINKFNQTDLLEIAKEMAIWNPEIVNFINMNPHHEWVSEELSTQDVIADLRTVEPILNSAIEFLESEGIGVNVRYYPMCRISEEYRRCICNDLQVTLDPYEWDYQIEDKDYSKFRQWGINCSMDNEEKGEPCCDCDLDGVCGGANKHFHKAAVECQGEVLVPQTGTGVTANGFYHYRKHNVLTLEER